ncbi:MAG: SEC-C domain-containing protein, partial [Firmicutes bacterium]|nr:SEC-C domain-containing protein [Bacillota bacterium]
MKISPNDPCWCGSGRKYKKCHMAQDEKVRMYRDIGALVP